MDTYEKKYKEAQKWIESIYPNLSHEQQMEAEAFFPELAESEDERIRKELIDIVEKSPITFAFEDKGKVLAWLESLNNKESKKISIWNHWKDGICGNGEGKSLYLIKNGDDYIISSSLGYDCDYILLSDLDKLMVQDKQEWDEEDEHRINLLEALCEDKLFESVPNSTMYREMKLTINWLNSLSPHKRWEPSDEQIEALDAARHSNPFDVRILDTLFHDLKKLME